MLETDRMLLLIAVADCIRANDFTKSQPMLGICVDRIVDNELAAIPQGRNGLVFRNDRAPQDLRLAVPSRKKWPNGYELKCNFLDGSEFQKLRVQKYARTWEKYANIRFSFDAVQSAEIRISFNKDPVSWSAIGTDALIAMYFPETQPTMHFGSLNDTTTESEWRGTVLHEFGHALGAIHEHQQPANSLSWNLDAVYKMFSGPPNNWTHDEIRRNIIEKYSQEQVNWTSFDPNSIMLYHFPAELFVSGEGTPANTDLSKTDKKFISALYPHT